MAFTSASTTLTCGGKSRSSYDTSATATLKVSSSGSTISWSVSMATSGGGFVYFYLKIANKVLFNGYYAKSPTNYGSSGYITCESNAFPRGNGTSQSGSFTYSETTKPEIDLRVSASVWYDDSQSLDYNVKNRIYRKTATLNRIYYTEVGTGTTTITDNYNNTFSIKAIKGANGTNNTAGGPDTLKWDYTTDYSKSYTNNKALALEISGTADTRSVYAKSRTTATYGSDKTATATAKIKQYIGPSVPTKLEITYEKSRLTLKENWTLSWDGCTKANNTSPIKGYQIRIYRKRGTNSWVSLPIYGKTGNLLSTVALDTFYNRDGTTKSLTIYPEHYTASGKDILPGDKIKFSIRAYTKYGKDNDGERLFKHNETYSKEYTVQNAGTVRVKAGGGWKEGQVYVKVKGEWKEADIVKIKAGGAWAEST